MEKIGFQSKLIILGKLQSYVLAITFSQKSDAPLTSAGAYPCFFMVSFIIEIFLFISLLSSSGFRISEAFLRHNI